MFIKRMNNQAWPCFFTLATAANKTTSAQGPIVLVRLASGPWVEVVFSAAPSKANNELSSSKSTWMRGMLSHWTQNHSSVATEQTEFAGEDTAMQLKAQVHASKRPCVILGRLVVDQKWWDMSTNRCQKPDDVTSVTTVYRPTSRDTAWHTYLQHHSIKLLLQTHLPQTHFTKSGFHVALFSLAKPGFTISSFCSSSLFEEVKASAIFIA